MTPSEREEIERGVYQALENWDTGFTTTTSVFDLIVRLCVSQVEKARAESKYIPSELELFTILKKAYYENSELTGDQLWLKLSKSIRNKLNQKGE